MGEKDDQVTERWDAGEWDEEIAEAVFGTVDDSFKGDDAFDVLNVLFEGSFEVPMGCSYNSKDIVHRSVAMAIRVHIDLCDELYRKYGREPRIAAAWRGVHDFKQRFLIDKQVEPEGKEASR